MDISQPTMFEGSASFGTINALTFDIDDGTGMFSLTKCHLQWINASFDLGLSHGTHEMTIIDWTDDDRKCQSLMMQHSFSAARAIVELNVSSFPDIAVSNETELELLAWLVEGSAVVVIADWGDGTVAIVTCVGATQLVELTILIYNYTYESAGTFTYSLTASNLIGSKETESQTITVYERIDDLIIYGNSSVNTPPGTGTWGVAAGADQSPLENIVCVWNMGENYGDTSNNVAMLNSSTPHKVTFSYVEADVGKQTINVNCSNVVSSQNLSMEVTVVWDNVTLGELTCNSSILWDHAINCQVTIVRFGTGACFEWDMGDGNALVYYQDGYCAAAVPAGSPTYVQVGHSYRLYLE